MRRRSLIALLGLAPLYPLAACGGRAMDEDSPLSFWNPLTGDDGDFMKEIVENYNATSPPLPVKFQPSPEADMYTRMYSVARTGDDIPDLSLVHGPRIAELARSEMLTPIGEVIHDEPGLNAENYLPSAWMSGQVDGQTWGVPLDLHGVITYYNEDLLAKYDAEHFLDDELVTVDELAELAGDLPDDIYAFSGLFMPALVMAWQYNLGGSLSASDGTTDLTATGYNKAYEALFSLRESGLIAPEDSDSMQIFNSGRALFMPDGTWGINGHAAIDGLNFGVANSIQLQADNPVNFLESHLFVQMSNPKRSAARDREVVRFLEFVRTHSLPWAEAGQIVASRETYSGDEYQNFEQSYFTAPERESLIVTDAYEYAPYVAGELWDSTNDIVFGRVPVEAGLAGMNDRVNARIEMAEMA